jgi:hypothetical protein
LRRFHTWHSSRESRSRLQSGWTRYKQEHKLDHVSGLTHGLPQKK